MSVKNENRAEGGRATRQNIKIGTKYSHSPFYKGCKLWNMLSKEVQFSDSITLFKTVIKQRFEPFDKNFII